MKTGTRKTRSKKAKGILRFVRGVEFFGEIIADLLRTYLLLLGLVAVPAILALVWFGPFWAVNYHLTHIRMNLTSKDILDYESSLRATLVQLLGGMAVLVGSYIGYRNLKATEKTAKASEESQFNQRLAQAIEHLGSDKLPIRLGGISSLEHVARDSEHHHRRCMEIMSSYLRTHRRISDCQAEAKDNPADDEVQAIMTVISRRNWKYELDVPSLDLKNLDLHGLSLQGAYLEELPFDNSNLNGADFTGALLEEASFVNTSLERAKLSQVDLNLVNFKGARLAGADLTGCNFTHTLNLAASQIYTSYFDETTSISDALIEELIEIWIEENSWIDQNKNLPFELMDVQKAKAVGIVFAPTPIQQKVATESEGQQQPIGGDISISCVL